MTVQREKTIKEIVSSIRRITRAIYLDSKRMVKMHGITGPQSLVVNCLSENGPLSSAGLSRLLHVTPSNITGIIDRLENKKLIRRVAKPGDRRVSMIELTNNGEEISKTLPDPVEEKLINGLKDLDETQIFGIYAAIKTVVDLIDAEHVLDGPLEPDPKTWNISPKESNRMFVTHQQVKKAEQAPDPSMDVSKDPNTDPERS